MQDRSGLAIFFGRYPASSLSVGQICFSSVDASTVAMRKVSVNERDCVQSPDASNYLCTALHGLHGLSTAGCAARSSPGETN